MALRLEEYLTLAYRLEFGLLGYMEKMLYSLYSLSIYKITHGSKMQWNQSIECLMEKSMGRLKK